MIRCNHASPINNPFLDNLENLLENRNKYNICSYGASPQLALNAIIESKLALIPHWPLCWDTEKTGVVGSLHLTVQCFALIETKWKQSSSLQLSNFNFFFFFGFSIFNNSSHHPPSVFLVSVVPFFPKKKRWLLHIIYLEHMQWRKSLVHYYVLVHAPPAGKLLGYQIWLCDWLFKSCREKIIKGLHLSLLYRN